MQPLLPQVSAAVFTSEDAARDAIRQAMREAPHWREGRLYEMHADGGFMAVIFAENPEPAPLCWSDPADVTSARGSLVERHDRAGWLGARETTDA